jgi:hypothetical protein
MRFAYCALRAFFNFSGAGNEEPHPALPEDGEGGSGLVTV